MAAFGRKGLDTVRSDNSTLSPAESCVQPAAHIPDKLDAQREVRRSRLIKVIIAHPRFGRKEAVIRNVSRSGVGGKASVPLFAGDTITVDRAELGKFSVNIKWCRNGNFGAALASGAEFDDATLNSLHFDSSSWQIPAARHEPDITIVRRPQVSTYRPGLKSPPRSR